MRYGGHVTRQAFIMIDCAEKGVDRNLMAARQKRKI
jgi:hypothetical protein